MHAFSITHTTDASVYNRRPSVPCRVSMQQKPNSLLPEVTSSKSLRTFKTKLKTHLFRSSFPPLTVKWLQRHRHFFTLNFIVLYCTCLITIANNQEASFTCASCLFVNVSSCKRGITYSMLRVTPTVCYKNVGAEWATWNAGVRPDAARLSGIENKLGLQRV